MSFTESPSPSTHPQQTRSIIVIGAGIGGIAAVRTYLSLFRGAHSSTPSSLSARIPRNLQITVIDAHRSPGGVWARERVYPGLYAHAPTGLFEFGDRTMVEEGVQGRERYSKLSGERVGAYLEGEAGRWGFWEEGRGGGYDGEWREMGDGERVRGRFGESVISVRRRGEGGVGREAEGWVVVTRRVGGDNKVEEAQEYECDKLLVATGCFNKPQMPAVPKKGFEGVSIHSSAMGRQFERLTTDPKIKHVVVVGGAKSSIEACNMFLPHMHPDQPRGRFCVTWVVRPGPKGVNFMLVNLADPKGTADNTLVRAATLPWATNWDTESWVYQFLHSGQWVLGSWLIALFWWLFDWGIKRAARYSSSENARKLRPANGRGMEFDLNSVAQLPPDHEAITELHKDDFEVFRTRRAEVQELTGRTAVLVDADGGVEALPCDAVIWCTGWWPSIEFFDNTEAQRLGIPVAMPEDQEKVDDQNTGGPFITAAAEKKITALFPRLRTTPRPPDSPPKHTAYTLLRHVVSPWSLATQDRSVAFVDITANASTIVGATTSALWATAWCEGMLEPGELLKLGIHPSDSDVLRGAQWETALQNAFTRLRWGQRLSREPEVLLETQAYTDRLCRDLGLETRRKPRQPGTGYTDLYQNWKREWFTPYGAADYNDIVEEFVKAWATRNTPAAAG